MQCRRMQPIDNPIDSHGVRPLLWLKAQEVIGGLYTQYWKKDYYGSIVVAQATFPMTGACTVTQQIHNLGYNTLVISNRLAILLPITKGGLISMLTKQYSARSMLRIRRHTKGKWYMIKVGFEVSHMYSPRTFRGSFLHAKICHGSASAHLHSLCSI